MTTRVNLGEAPRSIIGYCWPWTVRPGQRVDFCVSTFDERPYRADLVRIICGDNLSRAEMFKEERVAAAFEGQHPGRRQSAHLGSYVEIAPKPVLDRLESFTVLAMVYPTWLAGGVRKRTGGPANSWEMPPFHDQYLVCRWDKQTQSGWALLIDEAGRLAFLAGNGVRVQRFVLEKPLVQDRWFLLAASVDAEHSKIRMTASAVAASPGDEAAWPDQMNEYAFAGEEIGRQPAPSVPLRFAACADGSGNASHLKPACCFNGKLDRVRLIHGVLDLQQMRPFCAAQMSVALRERSIGFWDFGKDISSMEVTDVSANALNGVVVNAPVRGVMGVEWDGSSQDWRHSPQHYSAIHFHDDDLYDAQWDVDFSFTVPAQLRSGIYAARLRHGAFEEYIPFFVAPVRGPPGAKIALLLPTASYTAYTNITGLTTFKRKRHSDDATDGFVEEDTHPCLLQSAADAEFLLEHHRLLGKGIYANHTDGTLCAHASQRHPNMTIKPKGINWTLVADTYITDWLERKEFTYDIITDDLLHAEGVALLEPYCVVLTGTHPEYYSRNMLDAVEDYQRGGGRLMYLGGNGFYWVTSFHAQQPGLIEVRKDQYAGGWRQCELRNAFDGISGGLWERNARSAARLTGVAYSRDGYAMEDGAAYRRLPDSYDRRASFIFEGVAAGLIGGYGIYGKGAAGQELDQIYPEHGTPAHALHLARADVFPRCGDMTAADYRLHSKKPIADMVYFETPEGGAVFSTGSMSWAGALSHNDYDNDVSRMTENVLRCFSEREKT